MNVMMNRTLEIKSRSMPRRFGRYNPPKRYTPPADGPVMTVAVQQALRVRATLDAVRVGDWVQLSSDDGRGRRAWLALGRVAPDGTMRADYLSRKNRLTKAEEKELDEWYEKPRGVSRGALEVEAFCSDDRGHVTRQVIRFVDSHIESIRVRTEERNEQ